jgi:nucleotide-binding universal stress UspA family protein
MKKLHDFKKILIAVDDSKYAHLAAAYGFSLAKKLDAQLALVHVDEFPIALNVAGDPVLGDSVQVIPDLMDIQKKSAEDLFKNLKAEFGSVLVQKEYILEGNIVNEIIEAAKEFEADMMVVGTHGRTGFNHFISGSVAEQITRQAHCPVLIVPNKD